MYCNSESEIGVLDMPNKRKPDNKRQTENIQIKVSPDFKKTIDAMSEGTEDSLSEIIREDLERRVAFNGLPGLPVLGTIPAGPLAEAMKDDAIDYLDPGQTLRWRGGDFFLRVDGDSMDNGSWRGDNIQDGDYVLIRPDIANHYGEIAAVRVLTGGVWKSTLKRLCYQYGDAEAVLKPLNPKYDDIKVPASDVAVIGVYRGLVRGDG